MDITYLLWLQELRNATGGILDGFLENISDMVISVYAYLVLAFIYWCIDKRAGIMAAMNIGIGNGVNQLAKNLFCVYRPWIRCSSIVPAGDAIATAGGYSFPSSHTQAATAGFGSIAIWQKKRKWVVVFCVGMIFLVMFSRNYLGVHTPQDVIAGMVLCLAVMRFNYWLMEWIEKKSGRDVIVFVVGILLCTVAIIFMTVKEYPIDYTAAGEILVNPASMIAQGYIGAGCVIGFLTGWFLERRLVNFEIPKTGRKKAVCFIAGILTLVALNWGVCEPIKELLESGNDVSNWFGQLFYFAVIYIYIMAGFPAMMKRLKILM